MFHVKHIYQAVKELKLSFFSEKSAPQGKSPLVEKVQPSKFFDSLL